MSVELDDGVRTPDLDFRAPANIVDPFPLYRWLRENDPVHWSESLRAWAVTRNEDILHVLQDHGTYSSDRFRKAGELYTSERAAVQDVGSILEKWMGLCDPPDHTRRRKPLHQEFTSRNVVRARPLIQSVVDELLDGVAARAVDGSGEMELIEDFAFPLPANVIALMMGVPREDIDKFKVWSDRIAAYMGGAQTERDNMEEAREGALQMAEYLHRLIGKRTSPGDDLIELMLGAREGDDALTEDEIVANCVLLVFAGHETTTHLLGNGMYHLLRHPDQYALLERTPALVEDAVEEFLRYDGAVPAVLRIATADVELRGQKIRAGDQVLAFLSSANRDPERHERPDELDLQRKGDGHIAFGHGIHFCLGAHLARLEARIAFETLFRRFEGFRLLDEHPPWLPQLFLRGVQRLPLAFSVR